MSPRDSLNRYAGRAQILTNPFSDNRPNHVIAFIRPKPRQPPNLATFVVPLTFNKLDLRDYLYHVYGVEVTSVRSFINQPAPQRKKYTGQWFRPRAQKMMIAELVKPFVWPEPLPEEERDAFDYKMFSRMVKYRKDMEKQLYEKPDPKLRTQKPEPEPVVGLKQQVKEIIESGEWTNEKTLNVKWLDAQWKEVEKDIKF